MARRTPFRRALDIYVPFGVPDYAAEVQGLLGASSRSI
jgi:hypothetical protein